MDVRQLKPWPGRKILAVRSVQVLAREENLGHQAAQDLAREEDPGIQALDVTEVVVGDKVEMTAEVGADSAKKPTIVGVADVERVIETAELDEDAASEPVMVLDEAEQTAVEDIPALTAFKSTEEPADTPEDKGVNGGEHNV